MIISDIARRSKTSKKNLRKYLATDKPPTGFDPATSCLPSTRSTMLSYDGDQQGYPGNYLIFI